MFRQIGFVLLLVLFVSLFLFVSKSSWANGVDSIDSIQLKAVLASDTPPLLIDVREPFEFEQFSIDGAKSIPLAQLQQHYAELPKDKPIVVYCRSGRRSAQAVRMMKAEGFTDVKNLTGGLQVWMKDK